MNFKTERCREEFWKISPRLRLILCDVDDWLHQHHHQELTVTCLIRTEEEQKALFDNGQASDKVSVHQYGRGGDARPFKDQSINDAILLWVNKKYVYDSNRENMRTVIQHDGTADHLHFQTLT